MSVLCSTRFKTSALFSRSSKFMLASLATLLLATAASTVSAQPFSLICMPDPQFYTEHPSHGLYASQARWIRDNKTAYNTKHVIWLGDLTNNNEPAQWTTADGAYDILDAANIPFAVVPGNHDYQTDRSDRWVGACLRDLTRFNGTVGPSRFSGKTWYGGNMGNTTTNNENNYTFFSGGGVNFLVIGLEYAPRKETMTWANNLIKQYPNHRVIIFTHMYLTSNGAYAGGSGSATGTVGAEGPDLFEECASRHSNVFMVVCGHVTESKVNTKFGVSGNTIYEMLVDYQGEPLHGDSYDLGNGWLRIMQFDPATNKINASTVTPVAGNTTIFSGGTTRFYAGAYSSTPTAADHLFSLNFNFAPPADPYTYLVDSVEFHDMTVNDIGGGDQLDPDIGQADNGNWAAVWEDDDDGNGIYRIFVRGFDFDGNERFADSVVNVAGVNTTNAVNPAIAMAADGKFVVAWQSGSTAIKMRAYNANGTAAGTEQTVVSATSPGVVNNPDVAIDDAGNFVVAWSDDSDGNGSYQVRGRGYAFNYTQRFAAKTINSVATGQQRNPVITMAGNGDYVVAWEDDQDDDGKWEINARGFLANETQRFAQLVVNSPTTGQQTDPDIAMDDTGRFVVVWEDDTDLNSSFQIHARGFGATGAEIISQRTVNLIATGNQINPSVSMDSNGNWYPVWQDDGAISGGQGYQMMSNQFTISGARVFASDVMANSVSAVTHNFGSPARSNPVVSGHKSGRYIVAWADDMDGNGGYQILARGVPGNAKSLVTKAFNGTVAKSPSDVFYAPNASVTLTATPSAGYIFDRWSGSVPAGSETVNPLTITMNTDKNLTAKFVTAAPPTAPTGLTATAVSSSQINLTWTDTSANEANFILARSTTAGGPYTDLATINANTTSYNNTGLAGSTTYYYVVRAVNAAGASANSNQASATTQSPLPAAPSGLAATAASSSQINLTWTDNANNETNFVVARSTTTGGPYTDVATLAANTVSYSNTGLTGSTTYYYVVRATNAAGASANSNQASATTLSPLPSAPSGLAATAVSKTQINLTWTDNATNESNIVVARATVAGGPYTDIATLAANTVSYSNTALASNTRYYYVVRATNASGASANSNEANALTWPADMIIDNNQAAFTASANWSTGTSAADKYGTDYRFRNTAAVSDTAKWTFTVPQTRNYDISAWWSVGSNRSTTAPYIMPDGTTVNKNQQTAGGAWNLLATKNLAAGSQVVQLSCWTTTGFVVIADAVRLVAK